MELSQRIDGRYGIFHKRCGIMIAGKTEEEAIEKWNSTMDNWTDFKRFYED